MSVKIRKFKDYNYWALHDTFSGKTFRFGNPGEPNKELPPGESEFYDVSINSLCHGGCSWCYAKASRKGKNYPGICETWKKWMSGLQGNSKPFTIAIGSIGEPTEHPELPEFLRTVYESGVTPGFTTNGIILGSPGDPRAREIIEAASKYCGGVAVSLGNKKLEKYQGRAIRALHEAGVKVSLHHLISSPESVKEFSKAWTPEDTHVLLPLLDNLQSPQINDEIWRLLKSEILKYDMKNIAFGSKFGKYLKDDKDLGISWYPEETYSKNILLYPGKVIITRSSFDLRPIKIINV